YDLFVGKTLLHGDVLMWLMKTLLTSRCINQRGAGHIGRYKFHLRPDAQLDELLFLPFLNVVTEIKNLAA
ncbi:hypothetical protein, partial [Klebsiella quasipneumoniae]|uniref:hypothetical protein n=1 Tax=Klebsiella quasipneumoniae TaxID=1463165 RepID=UPI001EFB3BC7